MDFPAEWREYVYKASGNISADVKVFWLQFPREKNLYTINFWMNIALVKQTRLDLKVKPWSEAMS